ncbi:hypothetical protein QYF36_001057 [Acer negundo]|nr:hypothetical protein QYF36_001057 [Acer negundo]
MICMGMLHNAFGVVDGGGGECDGVDLSSLDNDNSGGGDENDNSGDREIPNDDIRRFYNLLKDAEQELYPGCDLRVNEDLKWLAQGPNKIASRFKKYLINGFRFRIKDIDIRSKTQNSGVVVIAKTLSFASVKDKTPIVGDVSYFGHLIEEMQTKNMLKRKREQQDIQLLARMGVVDSSKYKSNMYQVVTSRVTNNLETQNNMRHVVKRGACNNMESMSDDSETEEPSDHDIEETEDDSGSTCKKTRGRTRLQWLHLQKEPIQVKRNELCQPIGEPGKQLGQYIGFIKEYEKPSKDKEKIAKLMNDVGQVQWDWLVKFSNSKKGKDRAKTNKQNYGKLEMHHTSGTKSFARLRDELEKQDSEGNESNKITIFKATHTRKNDKPIAPKVANAMDHRHA